MEDDAPEDERTTELSTILAIFPELVIDPSDPYRATLELPVTPVKPLKVVFSTPTADATAPQLPTPPTSVELHDGGESKVAGTAANGPQGPEVHYVEFLPSLHLHLSLPDRYPAEEPPKVDLTVTPRWLPKDRLEQLRTDCAELWEVFGRDQVVYGYIDHLQQHADNAFGLADGSETVLLPSDLRLALLDFNLKTKREQFEKETFDCGICLEPKKGKDCHRLVQCGHVFCVGCLQDFYDSAINEGDVDNVRCLVPGCGKQDAKSEGRPNKRRKRDPALNPSELLQIPIGQELVQRYVRLKRKKRLESDKNTIYCPRKWCQGVARSKKHPKPQGSMDDFSSGSESDSPTPPPPPKSTHGKKSKADEQPEIPMSQRLAVCEDCSFAFCIVCRKGWHGEISLAACNPRKPEELAKEEQASMDYLKMYSTPCPTCDAPAQKTMGCNHMICFKCKTHFCYLCSSYLMPDNPYKHFNDLKSTCYMRLWELEGGDGEGGGRNWEGLGNWDSDSEDEDDEDGGAGGGEGIQVGANAAPARGNGDESDSDDSEPAPNVRRNQPPREMAIEFVNFARPAGEGNQRANRRVVLPQQHQPALAPAAAPVHARRRRRPRRHANHNAPQGVVNGLQQHPAQQQIVDPPAVEGMEGIYDGPIQPPRQEQGQAPNINEVVAALQGLHHAAGDPHRDRIELDPADDAPRGPPIPLPRAAPGQELVNGGRQPAPVRAMGLDRFLQLAREDAEDEWDSDELEFDEDGDVDGDSDSGGEERRDEGMRRIEHRGGRWGNGRRGA